MTISARNWAWDAQTIKENGAWRDLHPGEKLTLLCLAEDENAEEGCAFRSQENIAQRTRQSDRSVRRHLKLFEAVGVIKITKRRRRTGKWAHSVYELNVPSSYREKDPEWVRNQPVDTVSFGHLKAAS